MIQRHKYEEEDSKSFKMPEPHFDDKYNDVVFAGSGIDVISERLQQEDSHLVTDPSTVSQSLSIADPVPIQAIKDPKLVPRRRPTQRGGEDVKKMAKPENKPKSGDSKEVATPAERKKPTDAPKKEKSDEVKKDKKK